MVVPVGQPAKASIINVTSVSANSLFPAWFIVPPRTLSFVLTHVAEIRCASELLGRPAFSKLAIVLADLPAKENASRFRPAFSKLPNRGLLCRQFLGFAFVAQKLQCPLGFLIRLRDFLLHLGGLLFQFGREPYIAVVLHARSVRNQPSHDYVLLQPTQVIHRTLNRGFSKHARSFLERRGRDE